MFTFDNSKFISDLAKEYSRNENKSNPDWKREWPLVLIGPAGSGKTHTILNYCEAQKTYFYFSFKNISSTLALKIFPEKYPEVFDGCYSWDQFFDTLDDHIGNTRHAVLVFDDWDDRKIDDVFFNTLSNFLKKHSTRNVFAVLLSRRKTEKDDCYSCQLSTLSPSKIKRSFKGIKAEDVIRLIAISGGYPGYLSYYDNELCFEENIKNLLSNRSLYFYYAAEQINHIYRSPDSYSSLLHAIAIGKDKLKDIAEYAGFSLNKCDKYLRSLISEGILFKKTVSSDDLRSCTRYAFVSPYMKLWSRLISADIQAKYDDIHTILEYIDNELVCEVFKKESLEWMKKKGSDIYYKVLKTDRPEKYDVKIGDMIFDFAQKNGDRMFIARIWTDLDVIHGRDDYMIITEEIQKEIPFYMVDLCLCSIHRFADDMWRISGTYDNVHLLEAKFLSNS